MSVDVDGFLLCICSFPGLIRDLGERERDRERERSLSFMSCFVLTQLVILVAYSVWLLQL